MANEPKQLVDARAALSEAEADLGNAQMLNRFKHGIDLLADVIFGDYDEIHKNIANRLVTSYRSRVVEKAKAILSEADSQDLDSLAHWGKIMETFTDAGFDDEPELTSCKRQMFDKWGLRLLATLKPWEIEMLRKELLQRK